MERESEKTQNLHLQKLQKTCNRATLRRIINNLNEQVNNGEIGVEECIDILKGLREIVLQNLEERNRIRAYRLGRSSKSPCTVVYHNGTSLLEMINAEIERKKSEKCV